jgi:hypothetical protein
MMMAAALAALTMCGCTTPRSVSPPPTIDPEIREIERIVREQIERPPAECLTPPPVIEPMPAGEDWRQRAGDMTEIAQINQRIVQACQDWWARVEAGRGE